MARFSYNTNYKRRSAFSGLWGTLLIFAGVVALFIAGTASLSAGSTKRQKESLENAINRDIVYCYATTGKYPESLDYIKDYYGLYYNDELFYVDYKIRGSNLFPDVTIIDLVPEDDLSFPEKVVVTVSGRVKELIETKTNMRDSIIKRRRASDIHL